MPTESSAKPTSPDQQKPAGKTPRLSRGPLSKLEPIGLVIFDIAATYVAMLLAAWGTEIWGMATGATGTVINIAFLALVNVVVFGLFHLYSSMWRYASISDLVRIVLATLVSSIVGDFAFKFVFASGLSLRIYVMAWAILLILVAGVRLSIRAAWSGKLWNVGGNSNLPRTLVVGAGETGSLTIKRMLAGDADMVGTPVALVDDDPNKIGQRIHDVKVLGTCSDIPEIAKECDVEQIVLAFPSASATRRKQITDACISTGLKVLTLPNVRDIPTEDLGRVSLRDIDVCDLLGREDAPLDAASCAYVADKCVMVTGGGGSIGAGIARLLLNARPLKIVLYDCNENSLLEVYREISAPALARGIEVCVEVGSVANEPSLRQAFVRHNPQVVFHAAAYKNVAFMERDPREAVVANVVGTNLTAELADEFGCSHFVLVSTEKAVNPTSVMGATKRFCELGIQAFNPQSATIFCAVRFGNVLEGNGSVIPLFSSQIEHGGPVTLTDVSVTRHFITLGEAARLIITAGSLAQGGEVFLLNMGEPVRIYDIAEKMVRLSGAKMGRDIEIQIIGLRPGEKLHDEIAYEDDKPVATACPDITMSADAGISHEQAQQGLAKLLGSLEGDNEGIKRALAEVVPSYTR